MLKQFRNLFILLLILIVPLQVFSQYPTISIIPTPALQNARVVYFSNFDIFDVGRATYLFDITINNATQNWTNTKIIIELEYNSQIVATAESDYFTLTNSPTGSWTATNIDLINTQTFPGSGMLIEFTTTSLDPPDQYPSFEDELYGSGKAKTGQYILRGRMENDQWPQNPQIQVNLLVTNPSNIQISYPGNPVGSGPPQEIMTEFPVFSFYSDGTEYILSVYEKLSHHYSIEDVINSGNPIYKTDQSMPLTSPILNYAAASGQPFQLGSTYFWFVDVLVPTTAGVESFRSEVFQFKVVGLGGNSGENQAIASVLELLRRVVGNEAEDISKNLTNFELKTIKLNGKTITIYELLQIIESYEGHLLEISELALY